MAEFLRDSDAFIWSIEEDPRLRSTIVTLTLLDRSPDWNDLVNRFKTLIRTVPMFAQRVVPSPAPIPPRWEADPDFDIGFHLRRVTAAAPGSLDTVLEMARIAAMADFDRARPLWEVTVVDGLTGGGAAMLCKLNHALTDGVGAVEMAMSLFDDQERRGSCDPSPVAPAAATTGRLARVRDALSYESQLGASVLGGAVRAGQAMLTNGLRHPVDFITGLYSTAASIYRTARPISRPGSAIMHHRNLIRRLGVLDVSRPSLLAAGHNAGGTLNDAFIAAVAGGLRRYHLEHGAAIDDLVVTMPISVRTGSDPLGGNRAMLIRFAAPAGNADPTERIRIIHGRTDKARSEKALGYTQLIAGALARMPRWYVGAALRHVDFIASDVRGFPTPVFLAGAAVKAQYAFSPTLGAAVNVTLLSYIDTCALGMNVDVGAIPDYDSFFDCVAAGFDEVLALGEPS